jgi:hypothetical protein
MTGIGEQSAFSDGLIAVTKQLILRFRTQVLTPSPYRISSE